MFLYIKLITQHILRNNRTINVRTEIIYNNIKTVLVTNKSLFVMSKIKLFVVKIEPNGRMDNMEVVAYPCCWRHPYRSTLNSVKQIGCQKEITIHSTL